LPNIPLIISQESARTGGTGRYASGQAFGEGIGQAVEGLGGTLMQAGDAYAQYEARINARHSNEELQQKIAQTDLVSSALEAQKHSLDGKGVVQTTWTAHEKIVGDMADTIQDPNIRSQYKARMYAQMGSWRNQQTAWAYAKADEYNRQQNNLSLDILYNRVRTDAASYDQSAKDAENIIAADKGINEANRSEMRAQARSNLAQARFEGGLVDANSERSFAGLEGELASKKWQGELSKEAFARVKEEIKVAHNSFTTLQEQKARALIESVGAMLDGKEIIRPETWKELDGYAKDSNNPQIALGMIKLREKEAVNQTYGKAPPGAMRSELDRRHGLLVNNDPAKWASNASLATGGEIGASFMLNMLGREYSAKDIAAGKYNERNKGGTSSAAGLFQFTDGTWLEMFNRYGGQLGFTPEHMTDAQKFALRGDAQTNTTMAAFYAKENKKYLESNGIQAGDTELYFAHFLGPAGAVDFLKAMQAGPHETVHPSGNFSADQIAANIGIFRRRRQTPYTFKEVYDNFASGFMPGKTAAAFDSQQHLQKIYDNKVAAYKQDMMTAYANDGKWIPSDLNTDQDFYNQGRAAMAAAQYAQIKVEDAKPFTSQQADTLGKVMRDGDAEQKLQLMGYVGLMDEVMPGLGKAAAAQLGEKDTVLGYAASMLINGDTDTAKIIVHGNDKLTKAKTLYTPMLGIDGEARNDFNAIALPALAGADPATLESMFGAAEAYYIEKYGAKGHPDYNSSQFQEATQRVLGGQKGIPAVDDVNGFPTAIPPGMDASEFDSAVSLMTNPEFIAQSEAKLQPVDASGDPVSIQDVDEEGRFISIGGGQYKIMMHDDNYLAVKDSKGGVSYFIFQPDVEKMKAIAASGVQGTGRAAPSVAKPPGVTTQQWEQSQFNPKSPNYDPMFADPALAVPGQ
jgi:hypothetical protein